MELRDVIKNIGKATQSSYKEGFGRKGHRYITSSFTQPEAEVYTYFIVLTEASVTYVNALGGDDATAKTLAVGTEVYGEFTTLSVASGEILAYRK